ncbi:MAG: glycosyltransferase [Pyrinomonadaceae bacterium]|nr:glycosyltransferase [Pyrinomonadaceae bacterium]
MSRLLETYPQGKLRILTGSYFDTVSPAEGRLPCEHSVFPTTNETGPLGLGRIKSFLEWLMIPLLMLYAILIIKRERIKVIVTIAYGHFFIAAALASRATRVPFILVVHDDWIPEIRRTSWILKSFCVPLFRFVARSAAHIYGVTPYMQQMLNAKYGVESEVQMPGIECSTDCFPLREDSHSNTECLRIVYSGTLTRAMDDSFKMLLTLLKGDVLLRYGITSWELHLYVMATPENAKQAAWCHENIKVHGWVTQDELRRALRMADILFLPFSFRQEERYATELAFPSKTADYLESGKPILILAPPYSSLIKYARQWGFAEVVDEASEEKLAEKIAYMAKSAECRERLIVKSQAALEENHNIRKQRKGFRELVNHLASGT